MTRRVDKVVVYITRGARLLVFTQPAYPQAGIQVPAGTIEPYETPEAAARREAHEETGLERLSGWRSLGERERDMADYGRDEVQRRFFFHARCDDPRVAERWRWIERSPSAGARPAIIFELFWAPLWPAPPDLVAGQGALLANLPRV
jgi:8-oxo-dGTP pyrophosphatase MutT (NUDIX family)